MPQQFSMVIIQSFKIIHDFIVEKVEHKIVTSALNDYAQNQVLKHTTTPF